MQIPSRLRAALLALAALTVLALALVVVTVPLDERSQWSFAIASIVGAMLIGRVKSRRTTLTIAALSLLVSTRYIFWRTTTTLEFDSVPAALLGSGLYLAELYAWVILALGFLQTSWPLDRPVVEVSGDPDQWPTVDVYIPTYNESLEIVQNTVFAAMDMDYPEGRFRVFILDDGRRPEFQAFARSAGCGYLTRADNLHAKAGNLNAAMRKTDGELIAVFDCDHVPTRAFLQLTVGWFQRDPKLALMQTPHHFYSPDPVQRNLSIDKDMPGEGDLFYGAVQKGNDLWNATFFCGSCAVIRRDALEETNGFAGETVTEDAHTALKLQRMGWNTAYIGVRLSAGLATERLVLHVGQRIRWARGMTQIFRIDNPLLGRGLSWQQRLCYLNAMLHFQFPLPRIVFLTSPLAYLIAGQNIINASASLIFAYALPHLFVSMQSSERIQGGDRRPFWGEIYETLLAFHLVRPTVLTLFQPRKGKFNVTDKGGLLDRTYFDFSIVKPHLITIALLALGVAFGVVKYLFFPHLFNIQGDTLLLNTAWASFSLLILLAAVSVARERRQTRQHIRINVEMPVTLYFEDGYVVEGKSQNISMGGLAARMPEGFALQGRTVTDIAIPMGSDTLTIPVDTLRMERGMAQVRFQALDRARARLLVRAVMGRADAWESTRIEKSVSGVRSIRDIVAVDSSTIGRIVTAPATRRRKRRLSSIAGAGALLLCALGLTADPAQAQAKAAAPAGDAVAAIPASTAPGASRQRITFKDLRVNNAIRLAGTRGEVGIPFGVRNDQVVTNASLTLNFAHSPALLGDLSQLVVMLNGEVARIIQLDPAAAEGQIVTIPINPALFLPGDNQLNLRFLGHYARDCEDPFHSSLWANISNVRSYLDLSVQTLGLAPNLARLPAPFFDRFDSLPLKLPFVFAGAPSNGELEAAASLASWFGGMASYRGFSFKPAYAQLPRGNAVVFLTPRRPVAGVSANITGASIAVIKNPADPMNELLLVMGRNDRELKLAAAALASGKGVYAGAQVSVDGVRIPSYPRYSAPRWLRTDRAVRLGEIVDGYSLQGMGLPPGPLSAGFRVAPDLFFWPRQGATLNLAYRYPTAPWLDRRASRLDVSINANYLRTLKLSGDSWWSRMTGGQAATSETSKASVVLPRYNLFGQNQLVFDYNLIIADKKKCEGTLPDNVRTSILPESTIDLTHAYHALMMPDLATFANAGYPFTVKPDLGETAVVMAQNPSPATVEAFLGLMGRFGDSTGAPTTSITVTRHANEGQLAGKDILVIGGTQLAQLGDLFGNGPVRFEDGRLRVAERTPVARVFDLFSPFRRKPAEADAFLYATDNFAGIASFQSPYTAKRTVIALLASDPVSLPLMVDGLADVKINAQVQGDLSVVNGDGMSSFAVGDSYWVGDLPIWVRMAYWFSRHPLLMALSGLIVAVLVSGPIYMVLKRQERKRLAAVESDNA
ncbi:UDP-forming cellulose synthase catalytic subunit [Sphingomonas sp. C3-2]|uniref:UDP-forming cellulose synthase catalytic subunit n=1 Tax=Sphingomonas sp. C3-2 TaxID=3062169 RepID=UPI00294B1200|nr:UDP-forming cellulose synthase catalytic subunit [Sphingomonas sp. C3-2]WOK35988.1 UDP-forming cellulose synthase catalytic subunit [Sphingomonas sp. C3-2]